MTYVLGFFAADGSMIRHRNGGSYIEFHITDRSVLETIQHVTHASSRISERPSRNSSWKPIYRIQIGSKEWFADLLALGFTPNKSKTLVFPDVPAPLLGDFIRGYFDGDGCVHLGYYYAKDRKRKVWVFTTRFISGSKSFLEEMHTRLKENEVVRGGFMNTKKGGFELVFSRHDSIALYKFMYHTGCTAGHYLPRKRETFERAIDILYPHMRS